MSTVSSYTLKQLWAHSVLCHSVLGQLLNLVQTQKNKTVQSTAKSPLSAFARPGPLKCHISAVRRRATLGGHLDAAGTGAIYLL